MVLMMLMVPLLNLLLSCLRTFKAAYLVFKGEIHFLMEHEDFLFTLLNKCHKKYNPHSATCGGREYPATIYLYIIRKHLHASVSMPLNM